MMTSREWNFGMQIEWNEDAVMKRIGIKMLKICFGVTSSIDL